MTIKSLDLAKSIKKREAITTECIVKETLAYLRKCPKVLKEEHLKRIEKYFLTHYVNDWLREMYGPGYEGTLKKL